MHRCEDPKGREKFSPERVDFLYDNELDSDVVFLVGQEPDVWRIPGHRKILSESNVVFRALMEGPLATRDKTIAVEDVEGRAFDYLLRYLYGKSISFRSAATALSTLYAAHKYLCPGLIELCVKYLDLNLDAKNVLNIYVHARLYAGSGEGEKVGSEPSAPEASEDITDLHVPARFYPSPVENDGNGKDHRKWNRTDSIPFWSEALVRNCLQHIDENAEQVLNLEEMEDLSAENLKEIIKRDTLKIKSEYPIFSALDRWANRECKRRKLNLNSKNRRYVLDDLIYEIRFPFFTPEEFVSGPIQNGWLDQQELTAFSGLISSKSSNMAESILPQQWKSRSDKIFRKRIYCQGEIVNLSRRTTPRRHSDDSAKKEKSGKKNFYIFKKKIKAKSDVKSVVAKDRKPFSGGDESGRKTCCEKCFPDFFLDILLCLFD